MRALSVQIAKRAPNLQQQEDQINALVDSLTPEAERVFIEAVNEAIDQTDFSEVRQAVQMGDVDGAVDSVSEEVITAGIAIIALLFGNATNEGAQFAIEQLPTAIVPFASFNQLAPPVVDFQRRHAADLVVGVTDETRRAIRKVVEGAIDAGLNPTTAAQMIINTGIGPTERQAAAIVRRFNAALEAGVPVRKALADAAAQRKRAIEVRAKNIAINEMQTAVAESRRLLYEQLAADGIIDTNIYEQIWKTQMDSKVECICRPMNRQRQPIGGLFTTGDGRLVQSPGGSVHVRCRCFTAIVRRLNL